MYLLHAVRRTAPILADAASVARGATSSPDVAEDRHAASQLQRAASKRKGKHDEDGTNVEGGGNMHVPNAWKTNTWHWQNSSTCSYKT